MELVAEFCDGFQKFVTGIHGKGFHPIQVEEGAAIYHAEKSSFEANPGRFSRATIYDAADAAAQSRNAAVS